MNEPHNPSLVTPAAPNPVARSASPRTWLSRLLSAGQLSLAILITLGVLLFLLWPEGHVAEDAAPIAPEVEIVKLIGQHQLAITAGTPLEKKLVVTLVQEQETKAPKLKVTGAVAARLPPAKDKPAPPASLPPAASGRTAEGSMAERRSPPPPALPAGEGSIGEGRWDFNTPELASAYADWLKARANVPFYEKQLEDVRKLAAETLKAKKDVADRLEKLVQAGTDPEKDLAAANADYHQAKAQTQKDDHEALTNVNNAHRTLATLERQLFQAGVDPELLAHASEGIAIVVAEVPEVRVGLVAKGQACMAQFYAFPGEPVPGTVRSLAPTITKERRTLRVFFQLDDPQGRLKPGMFAEIGLGTGERKTVRIPANGVLHVGQSDYVLVETPSGTWKITEIQTGEQYGSQIEVLQGLHAGDRVIGYGAILLKPYVVQDVQSTVDAAAVSGGSAGR